MLNLQRYNTAPPRDLFKGLWFLKATRWFTLSCDQRKMTARTTQGWPSKVLLWWCYMTHILSVRENKHISFKLCVVFPEEHIKQIHSHTFASMVSRPLWKQTCSNFHTKIFKGISFTWISKSNKNFQNFWETIVTNILFCQVRAL